MIKFDLGLPPEPATGKEVMPRLEKSGAFYAMRRGRVLYIVDVAKNYIYRYSVPESNLTECIMFKEGKHVTHVIDCYRNDKALLIDYYVPKVDETLPTLPDFENLELIGGASLTAIKAVAHAAAVENIKPAFNGVCLFAGTSRIGVAATDSRRLSFHACNLRGLTESVILPLDFVRMIQDDVSVFRDGSQIIVSSGNVSTRAVWETFPNIENVIPADLTEYTQYIKNIDLQTLREYQFVLGGNNSSVVFKGGEKLVFRGHGTELDLKYESEVRQPLCVNLGFLLDALAVSNSLIYRGGMYPVIFNSGKQIEVIMPIQIAEVKEEVTPE